MLKSILRIGGAFVAAVALLLTVSLISEALQPTEKAEAWENADADAEVTGCGEVTLTVTNREDRFPRSPGEPRIDSIFPSAVTLVSPLTPTVLANTGDSQAVAILSAPLDLDAHLVVTGAIVYAGPDGHDVKLWTAETDIVPCPPETTTTTSTIATTTTTSSTSTTSTTAPATTTTTTPSTTTSTPTSTTSTTAPATTSTTMLVTTSTIPSTSTTTTCEENPDNPGCLIPALVIERPAVAVPATPLFTG